MDDLRTIARKFASDSIVTDALARLIEQVLTEASAAQRGWFSMADARARQGDVLLHLNMGHTRGVVDWLTVIGRWEGQWNSDGLKNMRPSYWSPIPPTPDHLREATKT